MRRLVAAFVVGIALFGTIYLGSVRLGQQRFYELCLGFCTGPHSSTNRNLLLRRGFREGWQTPVAILIGVFGVAGGLVILRTRPKPSRNSTQTA